MAERSLPNRRHHSSQASPIRTVPGQALEIAGPTGDVAEMADGGTLVKRSVRIAGHATSVSLEPAFWDALCRIAQSRRLSVNALIAAIDAERSGNLSSALRVFVLHSCRRGELATADVVLTR